MKTYIVSLLVCMFASLALAEVNESPIDIQIVPAFPDLEVPRPEEAPHFRPIVITSAKDGTNRIFMVSQQGVIYVMPNRQDVKTADVFLDIEESVVYRDNKNEEGLLGLAFHPNYKNNGQFFL